MVGRNLKQEINFILDEIISAQFKVLSAIDNIMMLENDVKSCDKLMMDFIESMMEIKAKISLAIEYFIKECY